MVPTACVEAASASLSASVSGPPAPAGPPDVSPGPDNGVRGKQHRGGRGRKRGGRRGGDGDGGMRWKESDRQGGREGANGVTLTEPVVDKTLRQIRQSRVWSLFCFPLLLLSGGFSLLLLSDSLSFSVHFFFFLSDATQCVKLFSSANPLLLLAPTEISPVVIGLVRNKRPSPD